MPIFSAEEIGNSFRSAQARPAKLAWLLRLAALMLVK
jgi:hypothetical protein